MITSLLDDVRHAARNFRRTPGLTAVAVLTLALGIGANTAMFSVFNGVALRPLPVDDPARLIAISAVTEQGHARWVPLAAVRELERRQHSLDGVCAYFGGNGNLLSTEVDGKPTTTIFELLSGGCHAVLGVRPFLGRLMNRDDDPASGSGRPVVVVSHRFWRDHLDGDPNAIGRAIRTQGASLTVIGVTPPRFTGMQVDVTPDISFPYSLPILWTSPEMRDRPLTVPSVIARVRDGVTLKQARAEIEASWASALADSMPRGFAPAEETEMLSLRIQVEPAGNGFSSLRTSYAPVLVTLVALTGLLLLLAAVNIGGQLLARAADREPELAIRAALGATRWRIARQLLIEGLLLSLIGVAVALPFAWWGSRALGTALWNSPTPMTAVLTPDLRVLVVIGLLSLAAGLVVGLLPAWGVRHSAPGLQHGRGLVRSRSLWTRGLLVAQVAMSVVLVFGGLLLARTLARLQSVDLGYQTRGVVATSLRPLPGAYRDLVYAAYYPDLLRRVSELPGVQSASYSRHFGATRFEERFLIPVAVEGGEPGSLEATAWMDAVAPGFFDTLRVPLLQGRDVTWQDTPDTPQTVLINQSLASRLFLDGRALGRRLRFGSHPSHRALEVVGIVDNVSYGNARAGDVPMIYRPAMQEPVMGRYPTIVARGEGSLASLGAQIRETVERLGREHVQTSSSLSDYAMRGVARERIAAAVSTLAGLLGAFLAFIGLLSMSAYGVARRTREIGIRMAVGADRRTVRQMIVSENLLLIGLGVAIGVPSAMAASGLIASLLFAVTPADPATLLGTAAFFVLVGIAASVLPASRAAKLDPASALRAE